MDVVIAKTQKEITDNFLVRGKVFVVEQNIDYELEFDGLDAECVLFVSYLEDKPVGAARLYKNKIGRVSTLKTYRNMGVATAIMNSIELYAIKHHLSELKLHAQLYVKEFYLHLGYKPEGKIFIEADIEHIEMIKSL